MGVYLRKLSVLQKLRLIRISKLRIKARKRALERKKRKSLSSVPSPHEPDWHKVTVYRRGKVWETYARDRKELPENFCLTENHDAVATFLRDLRNRLTATGHQINKARMEGGFRRKRALSRQGTRITAYSDFASMKRITPAAALLLASEYDRLVTLYELPEFLRAINIDKWTPEVRTTLRNVGFLSLLQVDLPPSDIAVRDGVYIVPFLSGSKVQGTIIDGLIRTMAGLAGASGIEDSERLLQMSRVYDGLGEAVQNVEDHAYPAGAFGNEPVATKWWMTGSVEPSKKRFTVVIYDQGVSIPVSLPRWRYFDEFRAAFAKVVGIAYDPSSPKTDGQAIAQAVQLGSTSTDKPWHGKGLPMIKGIVDNCAGGTLRIFSRYGEYTYTRAGAVASRSHDIPISGTLVEWDLFL